MVTAEGPGGVGLRFVFADLDVCGTGMERATTRLRIHPPRICDMGLCDPILQMRKSRPAAPGLSLSL